MPLGEQKMTYNYTYFKAVHGAILEPTKLPWDRFIKTQAFEMTRIWELRGIRAFKWTASRQLPFFVRWPAKAPQRFKQLFAITGAKQGSHLA